MTTPNPLTDKPLQPALPDLMARYLQRQIDCQAAGLGNPEQVGEVVPFEAVPVQPVDPRLAWDEALAAARHFRPAFDPRSLSVPPDWPAVVWSHEPVMALPLCLGNYPQLVRDLHGLLKADDLTTLRPGPARPLAAPMLAAWAAEVLRQKQCPQALIATALLRVSRQLDSADLPQEADVPAEWQAAWANEQAALAWHQGRADEALALWQAQPESVPVLFNRGMAALFLGRRAEAREPLSRAVAQLSEDDAWHHLGRLYLTLAEMPD